MYVFSLYSLLMSPINKASKVLGSQARLAKTLRVSAMAVSQWKDRIPAERVLDIYRATDGKVTPYEMRPDIYPDPAWRP
jgi:DNA-binding transcriptional regulator YdaS (Cro superfamily)